MKIKKNIILSLILLVGMQTSHVITAGIWEKTIDGLKSIVDACKPDGMGVKGIKESGKVINQLAENHLSQVGDIAKDVSAKLASEGAGKLADGLKESVEKVVPVLSVLAGVYSLTKIWPITKEVAVGIRSFFWQSQEEKSHAMEVDEKYKQLTAKRAFRECLSNKAHVEKNSSGIPCACQETAKLYAVLAGIEKANDMEEAYKQYNRS